MIRFRTQLKSLWARPKLDNSLRECLLLEEWIQHHLRQLLLLLLQKPVQNLEELDPTPQSLQLVTKSLFAFPGLHTCIQHKRTPAFQGCEGAP